VDSKRVTEEDKIKSNQINKNMKISKLCKEMYLILLLTQLCLLLTNQFKYKKRRKREGKIKIKTNNIKIKLFTEKADLTFRLPKKASLVRLINGSMKFNSIINSCKT
jgi:hypothetical protein